MAEALNLDSNYGEHEAAMPAYRAEGEARAMALNNRGPIRYNADGTLHQDIVESYWEHGFYIFEGVISQAELEDVARDVEALLDNAPLEPGGLVDKHGNAALGADGKGGHIGMVKPLSDPIGGTDKNQGSVAMFIYQTTWLKRRVIQ